MNRATQMAPAASPEVHAEATPPEQRLERLIGRLPQRVQATVRWLRRPEARWLRIPAGVLLAAGSLLSILPLFGLWMLPLGLMLLAIDVPPLQTPIAWAIIKGQRWWELRQRRKRARAAAG